MLRIRARCGYIYVTRTRPHGVPSKRTFATLPLRPVLLYIITLRCFPSHFPSFYFFSADLAADRTCRTAQYIATLLFLPARRPTIRSLAVLTRFIAPLRGDIPPPRAFRVLFARLPPSPRQLLPLTLPLDTLFCLFRLPLFPQAVQGSAFLCVLVSCGTHVLSFTKTSTVIEVFARLCIFIHCVIACFFAYAFAFSVPAILFPLSLRG